FRKSTTLHRPSPSSETDPNLKTGNFQGAWSWVTNGIYKILNAEDLAKQRGELDLADLSHILNKEEYPKARHNFLFDLMRKFELCFSFPEDDGRFLIPELLDKQQPPDVGDFEPTSCLNFQYHYPILPEGLLPRLIVRTHGLSTNLPRWRSGVILQFEKNHALVKADVHDKKVFISVSGPHEGRRRLLAVIRSDFAHIHTSFKFDPMEMVPLPDHPEEVVSYQELLVMEEAGRQNFPKVIGSEVVDLDILALLNGVDLEGTREAKSNKRMTRNAKKLFYSYSHKDESLRTELETHLKILLRRGLIESWHDRKIEAGDDWKASIDENLESADIILLLISADFVASDYCWEIEMKRALERHKAGEAQVVPVIIRDVDWHKAPFGKLQALPTDGKAVTTWSNKDTAWRNVAEGIEKIVGGVRRNY
ncbi:MAG: TIR domain-containing protein, partial [Proteobacteria bacterium]|nr:TIR domain-containing protein [Pseudomonadota bacterium]